MFTYKPDYCKVPIKIWSQKELVEQGALEQMEHAAQLPFAFHHAAAMPDIHQGYGAPIGGVLATEGYIIPNFIGVDIGCGMCFIDTNIPVSLLQTKTISAGTLAEAIVGNIMRNVPTGFSHHKSPQTCRALYRAQGIHSNSEVLIFEDDIQKLALLKSAPDLLPEIESGFYQVGTLGGGEMIASVSVNSRQ